MQKHYQTKLFLSRVLNRPLIKPRSITITLTSRCNLKCIMCDHWKLEGQEELSLETVKIYIRQIQAWGVNELDLSGGEPFFRSDILDIIKYACSRGLKINITTNGTLFTKEFYKILPKISDLRLQISLDGTDSETHDRIRGIKGTFENVLYNSHKIVSAGNVKVNLTTVIMNDNFRQLLDLYTLAKKLGFSSITYQPVNDSNLSIGKRDAYNPLRIHKKDLDEFDGIMDKLMELRKNDVFIGNSPLFLYEIKKYFHGQTPHKISCYSGYLSGIITPTNRFWSCMGDFGDLQNESLEKAWNSHEAKERRRLIKKCQNICLYPCYFE